MEEPGFNGDFLCASRVAIWGLGLMGGSLALALRGKCAGLVGIDADPAVVKLARERGVVDAAYPVEDAAVALDGVDLIILSAPVRAILSAIAQLPQLCPHPAVVIDLGSTKTQIVAALDQLPAQFDPLGGHPMCGREKSSLEFAEAGLYQGAPFALVALERTSGRARALGEELARAVGACPLWLTAADHDRWTAATSHAPFLLASALAYATPLDAAPLVGPGFRSTARLAGSSTRMMVDILATNAKNVRAALALCRGQLDRLDALLARGDYAALAEQLQAGAERCRALTGPGEKRERA